MFYLCFQEMEWNPSCLLRSTQGLSSILLSLKKCPIIRYQSFSSLARKLADTMRVKNLLTYQKMLQPTLLGTKFDFY